MPLLPLFTRTSPLPELSSGAATCFLDSSCQGVGDGWRRPRWVKSRWGGREPKVPEDGVDDVWVVDERDHAGAALAPRAFQHVQAKHPLHERRPQHAAAGLRSLWPFEPTGGRDGGWRLTDDLGAQSRGWRENSVMTNDVVPRWGHQGGETGDEVEGIENDAHGPVPPWAMEVERDAPVRELAETIIGDGRSRDVAAQMLEPVRLRAWRSLQR